MHIVEDNNRVIPGQLYILISFTPWILYWVLTGFTGELGVIAAFAASLGITTSQLLRREYNLMDLASITYFIIALIGVFILRVEAFVEKSGFLGYFALFLMALFSIVIKQPFTLQVSKRDYRFSADGGSLPFIFIDSSSPPSTSQRLLSPRPLYGSCSILVA